MCTLSFHPRHPSLTLLPFNLLLSSRPQNTTLINIERRRYISTSSHYPTQNLLNLRWMVISDDDDEQECYDCVLAQRLRQTKSEL